uniref:Uncharacterized protein n=1 Tax=Amphimedon queenslandica TaxID=400682 RepID=A0A1X7UYN3_AMPQE
MASNSSTLILSMVSADPARTRVSVSLTHDTSVFSDIVGPVYFGDTAHP